MPSPLMMSTPHPISRGQIAIVAAVLLALVLDGLDVQLLAFTTPIILREWAILKSDIAPALAASLVGMTAGSAIGGLMGDRWGRKTVLAASTILFGLATLAVSFAHDVTALTLLRFISGIGFGAATPNGLALVTEWLPPRLRARAIAILTCGTPLGGVLGSAAVIVLLPLIGWRGCFIVCAIIVVAVGAAMWVWLPESVAYLREAGREDQAQRELRRVFGNDQTGAATVLAPTEVDRQSSSSEEPHTKTIFSRDLLRINIGGPMLYFSVAFVSYALVSWLPTLLTNFGLSVSDALQGSFMYNALTIVGVLGSPLLIGRFGTRRHMIFSLGFTIFCLIALHLLLTRADPAQGAIAHAFLLIVLGLLGLMTGTTTTGVFTILSFGYPARCRTSGIGFGMMGGRSGGITTILVGGSLLSVSQTDPSLFFTALGCAMMAGMVSVYVIDRHVDARPRATTA